MVQSPFEIPQQLRELTEKNVEQASAAYGQFMNALTQAMSMWWGSLPPNEMTAGLKAIQDKAVRFAKQNAEAGCTLANSLSNAKDIEEVQALHPLCAEPDADVCTPGARVGSPHGRCHQAQSLNSDARACA